MNINLTFVIQIIHFSLTYMVLTKLLFNPIITTLKKRKSKEKRLNNTIAKEEKAITTLHKEIGEHLHTFQEHTKKAYPFTLQTRAHLQIPPQLPLQEPTKAQRVTLLKNITEWLVKKVPHDAVH